MTDARRSTNVPDQAFPTAPALAQFLPAEAVGKYLKSNQRIFVGVIPPIDQHIEIPEEKCDGSCELGKHLPLVRGRRLIV